MDTEDLSSTNVISFFNHLAKDDNQHGQLLNLLKSSITNDKGFVKNHNHLLTCIILSLIKSCNSRKIRSEITNAFRVVVPNLTEASVDMLCDSLVDEGLDEEPQENDESSEEEESDDEITQNGSEEVKGDEDEVESEDEEDEDENLGEVDEEFRKKLEAALGDAADNSEEETYLDDEQMFQLDGALSEVFRSKFKSSLDIKSKQKKQLEKKFRCLELVEIAVKSKLSFEFALKFADTLVSVLEASYTQPKLKILNAKVVRILNNISSLKKFKNIEFDDLDVLKELLTTSIAICSKGLDYESQKTIYPFISWLIYVGKTISKDPLWSYSIIENCLINYHEKQNNHIHIDFFFNILEFYSDLSSKFFKHLKKWALEDNIRLYKKITLLSLTVVVLEKLPKETILKQLKHIKLIRSNAMSEIIKLHVNAKAKPTYLSELLQVVTIIRRRLIDLKIEEDESHDFAMALVNFSRNLKRGLSKPALKCFKHLKSEICSSKRKLIDSTETNGNKVSDKKICKD